MNDKTSAQTIDAIVEGWHEAPHLVLGLHSQSDGNLRFAAFMPGAVELLLWDAVKQAEVSAISMRHPAGFFEQSLRRRKGFDYRLRVRWDDGTFGEYADHHAFAHCLDNGELAAFDRGEAIRCQDWLGAHLQTRPTAGGDVEGVAFAVWAPRASRVSVVGSFNNWDGRRHRLRAVQADSRSKTMGHGIWEIFVPHAGLGDFYKFEIASADGTLQPLKADPFARQSQLRPDTASVVAPKLNRKVPRIGREAANGRHAAMSIYEVHLGSWRRGAAQEFLDWDELAKSLPAYVKDLGFTHLEVMPITEHPFDGSWGYQTLGLFAPTARFGDADGLIRFVDRCHDLGIGVILDWVPAHFPVDGHGLARFDGGPTFEYADPREGFHQDWNTLIYDFGRAQVRSFLISSALHWVERFGFDGLRVDAVASMLYRDYSRADGQWVPNVHGGRENLEVISLLKRINEVLGTECPHAITLAEESTSFPKVSAPTFEGGLGFHFKWNMGWMNDTLSYMHQDPIHRTWHHDKLTFGLVYAFSEKFVLPLSHDEVVHGKGSLLQKMPGDTWQQFANLRAYLAFMWAHPGKKLLFMGQEFGQSFEWNHEQALPWELLDIPTHRGVQNLVRDLNRLMREHATLHERDTHGAGFEWVALDDRELSVVSWLRKDSGGGVMLVVCNFTPVPRVNHRMGVPAGVPLWQELLNTDSAFYAGSNAGNLQAGIQTQAVPSHGREQSVELMLPPLATIFLKAAP